MSKISHFYRNDIDRTVCGLVKESEDYNVVDDERDTTCKQCLEIISKHKWEVINRLADKADRWLQPPIDRFG